MEKRRTPTSCRIYGTEADTVRQLQVIRWPACTQPTWAQCSAPLSTVSRGPGSHLQCVAQFMVEIENNYGGGWEQFTMKIERYGGGWEQFMVVAENDAGIQEVCCWIARMAWLQPHQYHGIQWQPRVRTPV